MSKQVKFITNSDWETINLAQKLGKNLTGKETLILEGDLATGKTTFTKGIANALGIKEMIKSPSFVIAKRYNKGKYHLNHLDLYRLNQVGEDFDLKEYIEDGISVIEWASQVPELIPSDYLLIKFNYLKLNQREITFIARSKEYEELLNVSFNN